MTWVRLCSAAAAAAAGVEEAMPLDLLGGTASDEGRDAVRRCLGLICSPVRAGWCSSGAGGEPTENRFDADADAGLGVKVDAAWAWAARACACAMAA